MSNMDTQKWGATGYAGDFIEPDDLTRGLKPSKDFSKFDVMGGQIGGHARGKDGGYKLDELDRGHASGQDAHKPDYMKERVYVEGLGEASAMPKLVTVGDFYHEPDDITRGLTLDGGLNLFDSPGSGMDFDVCEALGSQASVLQSIGKPGKMDKKEIAQDSTFGRFADTDKIPSIPKDEFWTCGATTLYISQCYKPASLMNTFLQFLDTPGKGGTQVVHKLKVTTTKYAIKTDVYLDNVRCTLKARAYQQEDGNIAFEIQKRQGDSLAFAGVYRSAAKYLKEKGFQITKGMPKDPVGGFGVPLDFPRGKVDVRSFEPLLDMAGLIESPQLQAEAAVALAAATEDPEVVEALCSEEGPLEDISKLLKPENMDVVLPVAVLLLNIARCCSEEAYKATKPSWDKDKLEMILDKVRQLPQSRSPTDASSFARQNFAEALAMFATPSCRKQMSDKDVSNLAIEVQQVMSDTQKSFDPAYVNLQLAYSNLGSGGIVA